MSAAGARSGSWAGRAGQETGAAFGIHSVCHNSSKRDTLARQVGGLYAGAAGVASGARYEVVNKGDASCFLRTAPFANDTTEWRHSTRRRLPGQGVPADQMTRGEFEGTVHRNFRPRAPQEGPLLDDLRARLRQRGARGICALGRMLRLCDETGSRRAGYADFAECLMQAGIASTDSECRALFLALDTDGSGGIDHREFWRAVCGELGVRRLAVVREVFDRLDQTGAGAISWRDFYAAFDASLHLDVISGQRSEADVQEEFHEAFAATAQTDGHATLQDFEGYYAAVSATVDGDGYFEQLLRSVWRVPG